MQTRTIAKSILFLKAAANDPMTDLESLINDLQIIIEDAVELYNRIQSGNY